MKVPSKHNPRVREWQERNDRRNEALDCTVGAVWLCRQLRLHLRTPRQWAIVRGRLDRHSDAVLPPESDETPSQAAAKPTKRAPAPTPPAAPPQEPAKQPEPAPSPPEPEKPQPAPDSVPARPINARRGRRVRGRFGGWS